ncbi:MAG: methionine synthase [Nitrospirota bacterium]|jgi:5-methyltetrahydrofolate--homocysteine methyltransferase
MPSALLQLARDKVIVFDGAMGTSLQGMGLTADDFGGIEGCNEVLVRTRPEVIREVHASYLAVGADVVETDTFGGLPFVLGEYGLAGDCFDLARQAARIARGVADGFATVDRPRFVAGSMGGGTKLPSLGHIRYGELVAGYTEQARGLLAGGVDLLLVETAQDPLTIKAAIAGSQEAMRREGRKVPIAVSVTVETTGTLLVGSDISAVWATLEPYPIEIVGMNCATGPAEMSDHIRTLCHDSDRLIICCPNAGLPENVDGHAVYPLGPAELARHLAHFVTDLGVNVVGGCCGTTPDHISAIAQAVGDLTAAVRDPQFIPAAASLYAAQPLTTQPAPVLIGERLNANGSRAFREMLQAEQWDPMVALARDQAREGAHLLDVCVAYVGRDEGRDMEELLTRLNTAATLPLVIDSTDEQVLERALALCSGRAVINSINLEDGEGRADRICDLARRYGAALIALTIDEDGMAKTVERKVAIAERLHAIACQRHGLRPQDLIFDPLTFTLGSGDPEFRTAGRDTLEAITLIKGRLPGVRTVLGLSNCSFGLKPAARVVLNSVFLHEAVTAGLDLAIVHAGKILPLHKIDEEERQACLDLIHDHRDPRWPDADPLHWILQHFESVAPRAAQSQAARAALPVGERLTRRIVDGDRVGLESDLDEALAATPPLEIINTFLLDGMKEVGQLFGAGEMQLPFVLQAAEVMKAAVAHLEPHMERTAGNARGTLVLATVKGDVHDIGKNLVDIILTNNGYRVVNLGIKQPVEAILAAAAEHHADAIGLSGLLVKSTQVMKENLEVMNERDLHLPVLLGGAALTRRFVEEVLDPLYGGAALYGKDAFDGLRHMDRIVRGETGGPKAGAGGQEPGGSAEGQGELATSRVVAGEGRRRGGPAALIQHPTVPPAPAIPTPPFWGSQIVSPPLHEVFAFINETALFKGQWQVRQGKRSKAEYQAELDAQIIPAFETIKGRAIAERQLVPQVVYGYWPCNADGDDLLVFDPESDAELLRIPFPRQQGDPRRLCLADYFLPLAAGRRDVISFQAVTVGAAATDIAQKLFAADRYQDYLYFHGLAVETAEALAEYWHRQVRCELAIAIDESGDVRDLFHTRYQGRRYSFGYPACPDLDVQGPLFELLGTERIGLSLTEEFQIVPEQSTAALIVHHPAATYFSID